MGLTAIYVHGGVSGSGRDGEPSLRYVFDPAAAVGAASVASGECEAPAAHPRALDAVERAIRMLEDDPLLNAGYGSVLSREGTLELDAGIVDGWTGRCGAVAGVRVRHPITLARRVMERTPHVLLTGVGASALGSDMAILEATSEDQERRWREARAEGALEPHRYGAPEHVDTVGAVALDGKGRLVAGSSTGGVFGKMPGRVGDAPIFGAGIYASRRVAVVGSGVGELFLETLACMRVGALVERGGDPQEACEDVIALVGRRSQTSAALLALDATGRVGAAFRGAAWRVEGSRGPLEATRLP